MFENPLWDDIIALCGGEIPERIVPWDTRISCMGQPTPRDLIVTRHGRTISDPATVAFVVGHAGQHVAATGRDASYWTRLLAQHGIHMQALNSVRPNHSPNRTLLLAWPATGPLAEQMLAAYSGRRLIFMGLFPRSNIHGNYEFFEQLASEKQWCQVARHVPVRWYSACHDILIPDEVIVFDRLS
jgi:hypothetical protein